jgi:Cof subfamily protein (haloacid dehalogenase superfamily)
MLVCDVDGTLLDSLGRLSGRTAAAVATVVSSGVEVVLASGRILAGLAPLCIRLDLTSPQIAAHGALIATPAGDVVAAFPLSAEDVREHLAFARATGMTAILGWADHLAAEGLTPEVIASFEPYDEPVPEVHPDLEAMADMAPLRTTLCAGVEAYNAVLGSARERFGDRYTMTTANERDLDLVHHDATKASAAGSLAAALDIPMTEVAAIGDGPNDVALFHEVGLSAAMGNASPEVRAEASFVVPCCDEDGAAVAMERLFPDLF